MNIREFTVGCSQTFNLGNYESMKVEASVTYTVDVVTETGTEMRNSAQASLRLLLEDTIRKQPHSEFRALLAELYLQCAREREQEQTNEQTRRTAHEKSAAERSGG